MPTDKPLLPSALTPPDPTVTNTQKIVRNYKTTLVGALAGFGTYAAGSGLEIPHDKASWLNFLVGLAIAAMGLLSKDATTGSAPKK